MAVLLASASSLALFSMSLVALRRSGALAHRPNSSFNPNPLRCFVQTCCKLFQCRLTIVVAAGRVNSSVRRRTYSPLMPKIHATRLPNGALLEQYSASGAYTDCYSATLVGHISLADFMGVFYTTRSEEHKSELQ